MSASITLYLPCYNAAVFLDRSLAAVKAQTYPIAEVLVIDDGSTDDSAEVARRHGIRLIRHERNRGLGAARNTALRVARTEFIASLDADVAARPDWLERLVVHLRDAKVAGVGGDLRESRIDTVADRWRDAHMRQSWGERSLDDAPFLFGSNNVFRRAALLEAGGYDESRRTNGEDTDISRKLKERGFALRYEADAICDHMRTDTVQTICRTYWRWHNSLEGRPTFAAQRRARRHARRILLRRFLRSDLAARRLELAWLDLFMYLDWAVRDWRRFLFSPRNSVRIDRVR